MSHDVHVGERCRIRFINIVSVYAYVDKYHTYAYSVVEHFQLGLYFFCLLLSYSCRGNRTSENDGAEATDAHRERKGNEKHHATWKRPQVVEIARRGISSWTLALSSVSLCCLWICCVSNHSKHQNGLKMKKKKKMLLLILL